MRTRIKARRIWRQTRGRRRQGSGLVGGIASVATRASRAQPRAGSRSTRIGNDESSGQHGQPGVDDFAEGTTAPRPRDAPRVSSTRTLRRRSEKVWRLFFHFLAKRKSLAPPDPQCAACRTWASPHGLPPPIRLIQKFPPASFTPLQTLFGGADGGGEEGGGEEVGGGEEEDEVGGDAAGGGDGGGGGGGGREGAAAGGEAPEGGGAGGGETPCVAYVKRSAICPLSGSPSVPIVSATRTMAIGL